KSLPQPANWPGVMYVVSEANRAGPIRAGCGIYKGPAAPNVRRSIASTFTSDGREGAIGDELERVSGAGWMGGGPRIPHPLRHPDGPTMKVTVATRNTR